jgi:hypothetical protein
MFCGGVTFDRASNNYGRGYSRSLEREGADSNLETGESGVGVLVGSSDWTSYPLSMKKYRPHAYASAILHAASNSIQAWKPKYWIHVVKLMLGTTSY